MSSGSATATPPAPSVKREQVIAVIEAGKLKMLEMV